MGFPQRPPWLNALHPWGHQEAPGPGIGLGMQIEAGGGAQGGLGRAQRGGWVKGREQLAAPQPQLNSLGE